MQGKQQFENEKARMKASFSKNRRTNRQYQAKRLVFALTNTSFE